MVGLAGELSGPAGKRDQP